MSTKKHWTQTTKGKRLLAERSRRAKLEKATQLEEQLDEQRRLRKEVEELEAVLSDSKRTNLKLLLDLKAAQNEFTWKTRDGVVLRPAEMEESHLLNTICFLQRTLVFKFGTIRYLAAETEHVRALYEMLKEATRRGLNV